MMIDKYLLHDYVDKQTAKSMMISFSRVGLTTIEHTIAKGKNRYKKEVEITVSVSTIDPQQVIDYYKNKKSDNPMHQKSFDRNIRIMKRILNDNN